MSKSEVTITAKELIEWKNKTSKRGTISSVEDFNKENIKKLKWGESDTIDVLFSFLGIYAIGVWAYNDKDKFIKYKNKIIIKVEDDSAKSTTNQILNSRKFLNKIQEENNIVDVKELNEDINELVKVYFNIGNLIPIWPGGNTKKGNQNNGFMDIPELFFHKYIDWYELLKTKYPNSYLEEMDEQIKDKRFNSLEDFLKSIDTKDKYMKYINNNVIKVIKARTAKIQSYIDKN